MARNYRDTYDELIRRTREESLLASCAELLGWDELTYMPRSGVENRGRQMAYLAGLLHDKGTDPRIGEMLSELESSPLAADPLAAEAVNIREIRRAYDRSSRLPRQIVEDLAWTTSIAQQEWNVAREDNDFAHFRPWLERVLTLRCREAECLGTGDRYETMLDDYEPGITCSGLVQLFESLRKELMPLAGAIVESGRKPHAFVLHREYPIERQQIFGETVAAAVGFDFHRGRLDTTPHPFFSTIGPGDCRITTWYTIHNFSDGFFGILHELGHALYEQGLPAEHHGTPMGEAMSLGLHESQARLWENFVGRSFPFWKHFFPLARQIFHETLQDVKLDEFHAAINCVERSLNRVQADEVTYNLHILIRFELERALVNGDLDTHDLPEAWNRAYRHYLDVDPPNDAEGCLQDAHWGSGMIGYFPTYTLGNVYAAQLFAHAGQELGDLDNDLARGELGDLLLWLRNHVHCHGPRYPAAELIQHVTGSRPDHRPLVNALREKYGELYGL